MRKTGLSRLLMSLTFLMTGLIGSAQVHAASNQNNGMDFGVSAIRQSNQQSKHSYFDLLTTTGKREMLPLRLSNPTSRPIQVKLKAVDATTNSKGQIQYTGINTYHPAQNLRFTDLVLSYPKVVTIPKKSDLKVNLTAQMPKKTLSNTILGGIQVTQVSPSSNKLNQPDEGFTVKNTYAYLIGTKFNFIGNKKTSTDFSIGHIKLAKVNYRKRLIVPINNDNHNIIHKSQIRVNIKKASHDHQLVSQEHLKDASFAPLSTLPFNLDAQNIGSGRYDAFIRITQQGHTINLHKKFTITKENAKAANKGIVHDTQVNWPLIISVISLALLTLATILIKLYKMR